MLGDIVVGNNYNVHKGQIIKFNYSDDRIRLFTFDDITSNDVYEIEYEITKYQNRIILLNKPELGISDKLRINELQNIKVNNITLNINIIKGIATLYENNIDPSILNNGLLEIELANYDYYITTPDECILELTWF